MAEPFVFDLPCVVIYEKREIPISSKIAENETLLRNGLGSFIPNISKATITYTRTSTRIEILVAKYAGSKG